MLSRAIARGLSAEARSLATHRLALPIRDVRSLSTIKPIVSRIASPCKPLIPFTARAYATAQPTRKKATARKGTRASKAKPKKKKPAAKKRKPAARKKKQPTELEQQRAKVRDLRQKALLQSPKQLPQTAYLVFATERSQKGVNITDQSKANSTAFRNLSVSEQEHLQNIAEQNRRSNEQTVKRWIESHTPDQIRIANNARRQLNSIAKAPKPAGAARALVSHKYNFLNDARKPVKYDSPYIAFSRERWGSGDFAGMPLAEAGRAIGREWRALSPAEAQRYHDKAATEKARYEQEIGRVFQKSGSRKSS